MAITISFGGASLLRGGAYSQTKVALVGGFPLSDTGICAIIGEALQGAPGDLSGEGVQEFNSNQIPELINKYVSGPIVDAARLLVQPSRDARVPNGAQKVLVFKTNSSTAASLNISNIDDAPSSILALTSANFGMPENQINVSIAEGSISTDTSASVESASAITFPLAIAHNDDLIVSVNGVDYTCTVSVGPGGPVSLTQGELVTLLNGTPVVVGADTATPVWATIKPCIFAAVSTDKISATLDPTIAPLDKLENMLEYALMTIKASALRTKLNLTGASSVDPATLVVTAGGAGPVRGSRGSRVISVNKGDLTENLSENDNEACLSIQYIGAGSACALSIVGATDMAKRLQTTCSGASSDDLDILLSDYTTIQDLVNFINNALGGTKYTCVTSYSKRNSRAPMSLDRLDSINIKTLPLDAKCAIVEINDIINNNSSLITSIRGNAFGQIETISSSARKFLSGAVRGGSTNADFSAACDALLGVRTNIVIPLISQDATNDISDGLTDSSSTYTISSVVSAVDSHVKLASNIKNRSERQAYSSLKASFAATKAFAKNLGSERTSLLFQNVDALNTSGSLVTLQPWALACLCAGMQAGAPVGTSTMYKYISCFGISHQDFNPIMDMDSAIDNGLFAVEKPASGGYRIVVPNTTYGKDASFCWNRTNVIYSADFVAYDLRQQLESIYIGSSHQRGSATVSSIYTTIVSLMAKYLAAGVIIGDSSNNFLGYKDLLITMNGSVVNINVTITPEVGVEFILLNITLDQTRDTSAAI